MPLFGPFSTVARQSIILVYAVSILASFVGGAFASCISQYVMVVADGDFAEKVVAVVLPVNAAIVVSLQYALGRRLTATNIRPLMTMGTVFFVVGPVGFAFSGNSLLLWGISAAFSLSAKSFTHRVNTCLSTTSRQQV